MKSIKSNIEFKLKWEKCSETLHNGLKFKISTWEHDSGIVQFIISFYACLGLSWRILFWQMKKGGNEIENWRWKMKKNRDIKSSTAKLGKESLAFCRMYQQSDYDAFAMYSTSEIQRVPLESLILQMVSMGLTDVRGFPFIEPPNATTIEQCMLTLKSHGALTPSEELTRVGRTLANLPLDVAIGKILLSGTLITSLLEPMLFVTALLSIQSPFTNRAFRDLDSRTLLEKNFSNHGDSLTLLQVFHAWLEEKMKSGDSSPILVADLNLRLCFFNWFSFRIIPLQKSKFIRIMLQFELEFGLYIASSLLGPEVLIFQMMLMFFNRKSFSISIWMCKNSECFVLIMSFTCRQGMEVGGGVGNAAWRSSVCMRPPNCACSSAKFYRNTDYWMPKSCWRMSWPIGNNGRARWNSCVSWNEPLSGAKRRGKCWAWTVTLWPVTRNGLAARLTFRYWSIVFFRE